MEVCGQHHAAANLPLGKEPRYLFFGRLRRPQGRTGRRGGGGEKSSHHRLHQEVWANSPNRSSVCLGESAGMKHRDMGR
jgi:hypothetical protein